MRFIPVAIDLKYFDSNFKKSTLCQLKIKFVKIIKKGTTSISFCSPFELQCFEWTYASYERIILIDQWAIDLKYFNMISEKFQTVPSKDRTGWRQYLNPGFAHSKWECYPTESYNLKCISNISMCQIPKFHTVLGFFHRTVFR